MSSDRNKYRCLIVLFSFSLTFVVISEKREYLFVFYDIFSSSNVVSFYNRQNLYQMLIIDNIYLIIRRTFLWVHFCCETCKYKFLKELNFPENKTISDLPRHKQLPWTIHFSSSHWATVSEPHWTFPEYLLVHFTVPSSDGCCISLLSSILT